MQGNSKYLRWSPLYTCCCVFVILSSTVIAVPVRPRRMVRETYPTFDAVNSNSISNVTCFSDGVEVQKSTVKCKMQTGCRLIQKTGECCPEYQCDCSHENRIYENGERIIFPDPCHRCICKGGEVVCSEISCYIRDDCKPKYVKGVCCPQYDNCPPLDDVKLAVSKESDPTMGKSSTTTSKNDVIISLTTMSTPPHKDDKNPSLQLANENPLGIKIKEITKPEEIRITDDKPRAFKPTKSITTTTTTTTTSAPATTTSQSDFEDESKSQTESVSTSVSTISSESTTVTTDFSILTVTTKRAVDIEDANQSVNSNEHESHDYMDDGATSDEKILDSAAPPTKATIDGEVEPQILLTGADSNSIGDESSNKSVRQAFENSTNGDFEQSSESSSEFFSSTTESEFDVLNKDASTTESEGAALSVTHTPKNIIIVINGGKTESFHISGTDGLQRVEELDVVNSTTENSQEESSDVVTQSGEQSTTESVTSSSESSTTEESGIESSSISVPLECFDESVTVGIAIDKRLDNTLQLNESSTEHLSNNSIEVSTPGDVSTESVSDTSPPVSEVYGTVYYPEIENDKTTEHAMNDQPIETVYYGTTSTTEGYEFFDISTDGYSTTEVSTIASTEAAESTPTTTTANISTQSSSTELSIESSSSRFDEDESTLPENPEFPDIPDDFSIHNKEIEDERRLPSKVIAEEFDSSTVTNIKRESPMGFGSNESPSKMIASPEDDVKKSHEKDIIEARAPGEPLLIPEWERTTTEKRPSDTSVEDSASNESQQVTNDIGKITFLEKVVMAGDSPKSNKTTVSVDKSETSSSEEKYGNKEPTTARSTTKSYATDIEDEMDDFSSSSSEKSSVTTSTVDELWPQDDAESIKLNSEAEDEPNTPYVASYEAPSFKFVGEAMGDSFRTWSKMNGWSF